MVRRKSNTPSTKRPSNASKQRKSDRTEVVVNRNRRVRNGVRALQEIRYLRRSTKLLIPKLPFSRLVREIIHELFPRQGIDRYR
ncbi:uncharacterized protein LOC130666015 isoform X2 [Microplitis mediator]|uniref:uncharacterized protein LOC130666015 isoform X2 n=1 Tax=Microplitis mediator TaxID=375433 RepID=UPI002557536F|nr:uncharacterized protein LOC130666015 isoform X2 [Microplitis mediator]